MGASAVKYGINKSIIQHNRREIMIHAKDCMYVNITDTLIKSNRVNGCVVCIIRSLVYINYTTISNNSGSYCIVYFVKLRASITGKFTLILLVIKDHFLSEIVMLVSQE